LCDTVRFAQFVYLIFKDGNILSVCGFVRPRVCERACVCLCIVVLEDVMGAWLRKIRFFPVVFSKAGAKFILKFIISAFSGFLDFVRLFEILKLLVRYILNTNVYATWVCGCDSAPTMFVICIVCSVRVHGFVSVKLSLF
jgi:hypothetical protein